MKAPDYDKEPSRYTPKVESRPGVQEGDSIAEAAELSVGGAFAKLSPKRQAVVSAVLAHKTIREAAVFLGISNYNLQKLLMDSEIVDALAQARYNAIQRVNQRLVMATDDAVNALQHVVNDGDESGATRVRAAQVILDYAYRGVEAEQITERLKRIEKRIMEADKSGGIPVPTPIPTRDNTVGMAPDEGVEDDDG